MRHVRCQSTKEKLRREARKTIGFGWTDTGSRTFYSANIYREVIPYRQEHIVPG